MRILILFALTVISSSYRSEPTQMKWVIDSKSKLVIYGSTNVNKFKCSLDCYNSSDTLEYQIKEESCDLFFSRSQMMVPVHDFGCDNDMITRDFFKALKADQFPYIKIRFLSLSDGRLFHQPSNITGKVAITLAGITKEYVLKYTLFKSSENLIQLNGSQAVYFSDFNLKTPQKMMGLIQVQEDLKVEFRLRLRAV